MDIVREERESIAHGRSMGKLLRNLGCIRRKLKIWSKSLQGNPRKKLMERLNELEVMGEVS